MPKARITIVHEYELKRDNYRFNPDTGEDLSKEELEAMTATQMVAFDLQFL
jgi:hypothetical protein